jgi:hypothetical protein
MVHPLSFASAGVACLGVSGLETIQASEHCSTAVVLAALASGVVGAVLLTAAAMPTVEPPPARGRSHPAPREPIPARKLPPVPRHAVDDPDPFRPGPWYSEKIWGQL